MYRITVTKDFSSAHNLRGYEGNCENLHGHNWVIKAAFVGDKLNELGMLVDFRLVKAWLKEILDALDHRYLNELEMFKTMNPTSENIAKYIYDELTNRASALVTVDSVVVYENADACAEYRG
ncbi:6-carboxytetrahydropterin synthase QueD [Deferribacterales bacterium RsTz2092]|nr:6-carboxy-5,6,7,8-tetrahydropterin synthase [Deferribacterales bacterium]